MISANGRRIYATCEHHKVNVPPLTINLKMREELRDEMRKKGSREWLDALKAERKGGEIGSRSRSEVKI